MACKSCSSSRNQRSGGYGCRKAAQDARWYSGSGWNGDRSSNRSGSCGNWNCSAVSCGCSSCGNSSCGNSSCGCSSCGNSGCGNSSCRCSSCGNNGCGSSSCGCTSCGNNGSRSSSGRSCAQNSSECFPYYCGPCGPVDPVCGCTNNCEDSCDQWQCRDAVYGFFTQVGTLNIAAGGIVPFNGGSTVENIWKDGGELTLDAEGVYLVTLSADIPCNTTLYTELDVRVNGVGTPGGTLIIDKSVATEPLQNSIQTVITVSAGAVVTVTSSETVNLTADNASAPIVTLALVKIS